MDPIAITLIGCLSALILAVVGDRIRLQSILSDIALKANTLWEIYGVGVMRTAQAMGFAERGSGLKLTNKWNDTISDEFHIQLCSEAKKLKRLEPFDAAIELWSKFKKELMLIAEEKDVPIEAILGALQLTYMEQNGNNRHM